MFATFVLQRPGNYNDQCNVQNAAEKSRPLNFFAVFFATV